MGEGSVVFLIRDSLPRAILSSVVFLIWDYLPRTLRTFCSFFPVKLSSYSQRPKMAVLVLMLNFRWDGLNFAWPQHSPFHQHTGEKSKEPMRIYQLSLAVKHTIHLHSIGQNSVLWPHLTVREPESFKVGVCPRVE